ncbi:hypothetical protein D3H35_19930 [Cohnella faecalis]|uniref:Antigen I/II N-terminal domain-containing protein n=1 Tax=Cohnella faecalis TaxID=2315694 RepID=A0A398CQ49_9BACL|nr:hypothetical protein D3H35_19930 [Cohnella faecalis]
MKYFVVLWIVFALALSGCSKTKQSEANTAAVQSTEPASESNKSEPAEPSKSPDENKKSGQSLKIDKGLSRTEVTLPASFFDENSNEEEVALKAKERGISEVKKNADGSYTYTMSEDAYNKIVKETKESTLEYINGLKGSSDFPSIKDIEYDDSLTEFTLIVDKTAFEKGFEGMVAIGISASGMMYQAFNGVKPDKLKVTVHAKDVETKKVFKTTVYPDAFQQ